MRRIIARTVAATCALADARLSESGGSDARVERLEDEALLRGAGPVLDDLDPVANTRHAAVLRAQLAHARITRLDPRRRSTLPGVAGILTGADVAAMSKPSRPASTARSLSGRRPRGRRYVGEPLAVVVARDRYVAEDALELIQVDYEPLEPVMDPLVAAADPGLLASDRSFRYGDPERAFANADLVVSERFSFPRWSGMPVECYAVVAEWDAAAGSLSAWANFQGPFTLHSVAAASLGLAGSKLRLVTPPDSGGSYGIKSTVYVYVVLMGLAVDEARRARALDRRPARAPGWELRSDGANHGGGGCLHCRRRTNGRSLRRRSRMSEPTSGRPSRPRSTACTARSRARTGCNTSRPGTASS